MAGVVHIEGSSSAKPRSVSQIQAYIPIVLDLIKMNYDVWRELFETHCVTFGVEGHLDGTTIINPTTETKWKEHDGFVKMWIYRTISDALMETILKPKSTTRDLWLELENLFRDNKESRAIQLDNELRTITTGDLSIQDYCRQLKSLSDLLANVDSPVTDRALVMHFLNGLTEKYDNIQNIIRHRSPFPTFHTARSMLLQVEDRLSQQIHPTITHTPNASSPQVLYVGQGTQSNNHTNSNHHTGFHNNNNRNRGGRHNRGRGRHNQSSYYGNNAFPANYNYPPWMYGPPPPQWPLTYYQGGNTQVPQSPAYSNNPPSPSSASNSILSPYTPRSNHEAHLTHDNASFTGPSSTAPAALVHALNSMNLQDPPDASWYMDTGTTNHITAHQGTLNYVFNMSTNPSVLVGNGSYAPVTKAGNDIIHSPSRPLLLNNVLLWPSIIKNLVFVRQFATDNHCAIEFDLFGFFYKGLNNLEHSSPL